ncbi:amidohydrolase [Streptomyces sp. J2-1]|uniref:amidohydrolase n=1 Tax=Streptomyces corallincola TaxID=2851888 RepID=UPI001C38601A|nr:amidohydrolase [Streptomyces corallincola]MBV2354787.1 amidohydrolase [Streptomyces corallincola]
MNAVTAGVEHSLSALLGAGAMNAAAPDSPKGLIARYAREIDQEMIDFRRDLHRHPEASNAEFRTTRRVAERLERAGLMPVVGAAGTGLVCDIPGADPLAPVLALRGDLDALPVDDEKDVPYRSSVPRMCHACGHDVHTTVLLGAGLVLARLAAVQALPGPVRLLFQPAEEKIAGARAMIEDGSVKGVARVLALHCDPKIDVGRVGLRVGALTSACDLVKLTVRAVPGEVTGAEPPNVVDAVSALVSDVPAAVSRQLPAGSGASVVWGHVEATSGRRGGAKQRTGTGYLQCTVRCIDERAWDLAEPLFRKAVSSVCALHGVVPELEYTRGVPPVVNEATSIEVLRLATEEVLGATGVATTEQSLGGEDFAWFLREEGVRGAMARLGVRVPGTTRVLDLHQGSFDVDERALGVATRVLAMAALTG